MTTSPDMLYHMGGVPVGGVEAFGAGQVYYVCQTTNALYATDWIQSKFGAYKDGTERVHTDIQSALDVTVSNRNDYVIVMPDSSDYDITAALTLEKHRVHVLAASIPQFATYNMVRIHQTTADVAAFQVSTAHLASVEVAGFFIKCATDAPGIHLGTVPSWHLNIHHNFVGIATSDGDGIGGIAGTGACNHAAIWHNYVNGYSPASTKTVDSFITLASGSTRSIVSDNWLVAGSGLVAAKGIDCSSAVDAMVYNNKLHEGASALGATAGTFTIGIHTSFNNFLYDNYFMMGTPANGIVGGTSSQTALRNYEGTNGSTVLV